MKVTCYDKLKNISIFLFSWGEDWGGEVKNHNALKAANKPIKRSTKPLSVPDN